MTEPTNPTPGYSKPIRTNSITRLLDDINKADPALYLWEQLKIHGRIQAEFKGNGLGPIDNIDKPDYFTDPFNLTTITDNGDSVYTFELPDGTTERLTRTPKELMKILSWYIPVIGD